MGLGYPAKGALAARQVAKDGGSRAASCARSARALVRGQVLPGGVEWAGNYYPPRGKRGPRREKCGSGCVNARFVVSERATRGGDTPDTPIDG
ncbi:hypothetical protein GCM10010185_18820 [Saccharothrix coeruleofusca]|uniref:Uncharacterized protein n=1 Tax=Saccharothrix coeruleofusca TaxID=33919 RepID=A0A918ECA0_9PSEU|nr:hypothetical protein GCM10010185_18820 [Saccharothrix coeruleofusca]